VVALLSGAACTDLDSATNLHPEGPPMIQQVRMKEMYTDAGGNIQERGPLFAFGTHKLVESADQAHPVTSAKAVENNLRVIMDELLVGNYLEEINCREQVDEDSYDTVPVGATPDDIAKCAVPKDVLKGSCKGDHTVCMCKLDTGCGVNGEIKKGEPVGVLDVNQDGAADQHRMIQGSVGLRCGTIDVPIDLLKSYWNPSGDQQVPAMGGFDALGPAIVLVPSVPSGAPSGTLPFYPTNTTCNLTFAPSVVDKQGNQVCAPPDGDITKSCTPGDVSAFSFKVEPLAVRAGMSSIQDGDTGVSRTGSVNLKFSAPIAAATLGAVTMTEGTNAFTGFTATQPYPDTITLTWTGVGLAANQDYTIHIGSTLADLYMQPIPMPVNISFKTGS
jgi:hypothetical protein